MKKGRFLWSAHRITEKQKAGKARNIKEKQLKNSRSTASRQPVALRSSASADFGRFYNFKAIKIPENERFPGFSYIRTSDSKNYAHIFCERYCCNIADIRVKINVLDSYFNTKLREYFLQSRTVWRESCSVPLECLY